MEGEFRADGRVVLQAIAGRRVVADVQDDGRARVLEIAGTHQEWPAQDLLLGGSERDHDGARNIEALHDPLGLGPDRNALVLPFPRQGGVGPQ